MAVADVSAGYQKALSPLSQGLKEKAGMNPSGAHDPDQTHIRRILDSRNPRQIGPGVGAPVTDKSEDFRRFG
jgi:hypothetical protein